LAVKKRVGIRPVGQPLEKAQALVTKDFNGDPNFFQSIRLQLGINPLDKPYAQHPYLYAAINAIACNIAGVPFEIQSGTRKNPATVESGPWVDLFDAPNPLLSRYQLWESTMIHLSLGGECLWVLEGKGAERQENEVPTEIWPHSGHAFKPRLKNGMVMGWNYNSPSGVVKELEASQVIQFKYFNPYDPLRGLSPLDPARMAVRQDHKASVFNEAFFDNGCDVGGILTSPKPLSPEKEGNIRTQLEERHQGSKKRGRLMVLHGGMEYTQNEITHRDMEFIEQRKWTRDEILAVYKVPKAEVSIYEDLNFATALSQDRGFWQKTLIPKMRYIEDVLYHRLFKSVQGGAQWGMFDLGVVEALQSDFADKTKTAETLWRMGYPVNVINERLQLGLPKVAWGDEALVNSTQTTASALVEGAGEPQDGGGGSGEPGTPPAPVGTGKTAPAVAKQDRAQDPAMTALWEEYIGKVFAPREREFMVKLRVYFGAQKRDVLNRLARVAAESKSVTKDITPSQIEEILFVREEWDASLKASLRPTYKRTTQASIAQLRGELGSALPNTFNALDPNVLEFLRQKEITVTGINETTTDKLRQTLFDGIKEGETVNGLQDRIKNVYNLAAGDARRLTIARTETAQVLSGVRSMAFEEAGIEKQKWVTAKDEAVRPSHLEQDGFVRDVGDAFPNGLTHPSEMGAPPEEIINCRCVAIAVPKETPVTE